MNTLKSNFSSRSRVVVSPTRIKLDNRNIGSDNEIYRDECACTITKTGSPSIVSSTNNHLGRVNEGFGLAPVAVTSIPIRTVMPSRRSKDWRNAKDSSGGRFIGCSECISSLDFSVSTRARRTTTRGSTTGASIPVRHDS